MYFTNLPDHSNPGFNEAKHFSMFQHRNIVFNAVSYKSYCDRHVGCLSLKTVYGGEESYMVEKRKLTLRQGQLLMLNNHQEYSCRTDTAGQVRIQSVFFDKLFAAAAFRDVISNEDILLNNPFEQPAYVPSFFQALDNISPVVESTLKTLMNALDNNGYDGNMVDEQLLYLLQHLVLTYKKQEARTRLVASVKPATKKEIFKRLCIAKDFIHSEYMNNPGLSHIGQAACISVPQFVRQFKAAFHTTPHQYLAGVKLYNAARLLHHTTMPVHEITWQCGFADTSAFCRAFKAQYGVAPLNYPAARRQN